MNLVRAWGATLRELRRQRGITLRALARRVGISVAALRRVEKGEATEWLPFIRRFMAVYDAHRDQDLDEASFLASLVEAEAADRKTCSNRSLKISQRVKP